MPVQTAIQVRRGTAASWTSTNPTLAAGEIGFETDTGKFKIGTGSTAWASLAYAAIDAGLLAAKGDLVTATANDTPAVLTVGSNGETLVADSSTSTGLRYNPQNALANPVINGGFDIWQRGTSFTIPANVYTYTADRWQVGRGATGVTVTRQTTSDTTNLPNIQYAIRVARDSGNTATNNIELATSLESVNTTPIAGKTITVSFYARRGANFSGASNNLVFVSNTGTGTDQNILTGYTNNATLISDNATLTTTWQRFAYTATVATNANEIGFYFRYTPSGTAGAADHFELTGLQVDLGTYTASSAPTFRRAGGNIAGELLAAQRYYEKSYNLDLAPGINTQQGMVYNTGASDGSNNAGHLIVYKVPKRVNPTFTFYQEGGTKGNWAYTRSGVATTAATGLVAFGGNNSIYAYITVGASWTIANVSGHWTAEAEL